MDTGAFKYIILPLIGLDQGNKIWIEGNTFRIKKRLFNVYREEKYWRNIIRIIQSYIPSSINRKKIQIEFNEQTKNITTNKNGHFHFEFQNNKEYRLNPGSIKFFRMKGGKKIRIGIPESFDQCFFSYQKSKIGIISDIDDTILVTHTRNSLKKVKTLLTKNAYKRNAVKEMREFYISLSNNKYPFFYVSNSEANLYPMIRLFLNHNHFPTGPIFLKPFIKWNSLFKRKTTKGRDGHKKEKIRFLLKTFPEMSFILIGDDSQKDPEIYGDIAREAPDRIKHIYIRNINKTALARRLQHAEKIETHFNVKFTYFKSPANVLLNQKNVLNSYMQLNDLR